MHIFSEKIDQRESEEICESTGFRESKKVILCSELQKNYLAKYR